MQITVRGSLLAPIRVENLGDVLNVARRFFKADLVRAADIPDALVAPGTSCFALPARHVAALKLQRRGTRKARAGGAFAFFGIYEPVRLIVLDRECCVDVVKVPDGCPTLLGELPLRLLDLAVVDGKLAGDPRHDGHPMVDIG